MTSKTAESGREDTRSFATTLTMAVLIAANTAPLVGVLFFDWKVFEVMALFWVENVFIGVLNLLRMGTILVLRKRIETIFLGPFFCFHYGMFTLVHGVFVMTWFGPKDAEGNPVFDAFNKGADPFEHPIDAFLPMFDGLYWAAAALFFSHFVSYLVHFLMRGEYRTTNGGELMSKPYGRVVVLHITIIIGGFLAMATGENMYALALLVLLKIGMDIGAHRKQHAEAEAEEEQLSRMGVAFGGKKASGVADKALADTKLGGNAQNGFTIAALKSHPRYKEIPPWAKTLLGFIGNMMNVDVRGSQARGMIHKYLRDMKVKGKSLPEDLTSRIQHVGIRQGRVLKMLLDDETVISFDYFANCVHVNGPRAHDRRNIEAAVALAECLQGFDEGVRIRASAVTLENDLGDSLGRSTLRITR